MTLALGLAIIAMGCVLAAAINDVRAFEIPDGLSIALLVTAALYGLLTPGFGWLSHLAAPLIMFGVGLLLFSRGWMGGGDIKLLIAVAAWTGLSGLPEQLVAVAIAGGGLALVLIIARRIAAARAIGAGKDAATLPKLFRRDAPLPYAVAIAAGTGWWAMQAWPIR
ncbi:MAG: A24 family peptidase [Polymorphobacter sp.]